MSDAADDKPQAGEKPERPALRDGDTGIGSPILADASEKHRHEDAAEGTDTPSVAPPLREGDDGLGLPKVDARSSRALTAEEIERYRRRDEDERRRLLEDILAAERAATEGFRVPAPLRSFALVGVAALAAVLGLLVVTQVLSALASISTLPTWSQWSVLGALGIMAAVILYACLRLVWLYLRLRKSKRLNLEGLKALAQRGQLQIAASEKLEDAAAQLVLYLEEYPLDAPDGLLTAGLTDEDVATLLDQRRQLLNRRNATSARFWVDDFQQRFQAVLDAAAGRRIKGYATRAGVKTAVSPFALLDNTIILHSCFMMLGDLMRIYNLKVGGASIAWILVRIVAQAYLAGHMQDLTEAVVEAVPEYGGELGGQLLGIAKKIGAKTGEGALNGLFVHRLGKNSIRLLQPTRPR